MRVLKIIHTMGHGGAENTFRWLAWQLKEEGVQVVAGIPKFNSKKHKENWIGSALEEMKVPIETYHKEGHGITFGKNLYCLINKIKPEIVHSHLLDSNFYSSLVSRWSSIPHISTEHGDVALLPSLNYKIKFSLTSIFSNSIVCVSEAVKRKAKKFSIFPEKLKVIYNGIKFFPEQTSSFRKELGLSQKQILIGNIGNLYPVKGQKYLIQAFSRFLKVFPDACLVLIGRGEERKTLENQIDEYQIPKEKIKLTGFRNDIGNIVKALDIYVQPSLSEGFPVSILETLTEGVPVIATAVGGVPEIIGKSTPNILVQPGSSEEIFKGLENVAKKLGEYKEEAAVFKKDVREKFSCKRMALNYISLYERIKR